MKIQGVLIVMLHFSYIKHQFDNSPFLFFFVFEPGHLTRENLKNLRFKKILERVEKAVLRLRGKIVKEAQS